MSDFLAQMAAASAERAARVPAYRDSDFDKPLAVLEPDAFDVIAEIKERSPAEGGLAPRAFDRVARARQYAGGGAAAVSVLTEPSRFDGALAHLSEIAAALPQTPVMRKDFLVDPGQVSEARAAGASGVLLIVAMLDDGVLRSMLDRAAGHGMFVLLEAFDRGDILRTRDILNDEDRQRAADGRLLFGVNARNLRTLGVDQAQLRDLAPELPAGIRVAESGLHTPEDAGRAASFGYTMALVGTALMRAADPAGLIAAMKEAGTASLAA